MSQSIVVLYRPSKDTERFELYYKNVHLPLANDALTGLVTGVQTGKVADGSLFYRFAKLDLPEGATAEATMKTVGMQKVVQDLGNFAYGGVEVLVVENDPPAGDLLP